MEEPVANKTAFSYLKWAFDPAQKRLKEEASLGHFKPLAFAHKWYRQEDFLVQQKKKAPDQLTLRIAITGGFTEIYAD